MDTEINNNKNDTKKERQRLRTFRNCFLRLFTAITLTTAVSGPAARVRAVARSFVSKERANVHRRLDYDAHVVIYCPFSRHTTSN